MPTLCRSLDVWSITITSTNSSKYNRSCEFNLRFLMLNGDLILTLVIYSQPLLLGLVGFSLAKLRLLNWTWSLRYGAVRNRLRGTRFFECAAYPRLTGWLRFSTQGLTLCAFFLLYDLDLVFFFAETTSYELWTVTSLVLLVIYFLFFIVGVCYDVWRSGLMWL